MPSTTITPVIGQATINVGSSNYRVVESWTGSSPPLAPLSGQSIVGSFSVALESSVQLRFSIITPNGLSLVTGVISHSRLSITYAATRTGGGGSNALNLLGIATTDNASGIIVQDDVYVGTPIVNDNCATLFPASGDYIFARTGVFDASLSISAVSLLIDLVDIICNTVSPNTGPEAGGNVITLTFQDPGFGIDVTALISSIEFDPGNFADMLTWTIISPFVATIEVPAGTTGIVDLLFNGNGSGAWLSVKANSYTYAGLRVDSAFPTQGGTLGGANVSITGEGFSTSPVTDVLFGTTPGTNIFVINDNTLSVYSPAHALGSVAITVITALDTATSPTDIFEFIQFQFTLPTIRNDDVTIYVGDKIIIDSPDGGLDQIEKIEINYVDPVTNEPHQIIVLNDPEEPGLYVDGVFYIWLDFIFVEEETVLMLYMPPGLKRKKQPVNIEIILYGTFFSGSVRAGFLTILFADGSGIYNLDSGQTADTIYFREGVTTLNKFLMLSGLPIIASNDEEAVEEDFYKFLQYPYKIMSFEDDPDEGFMADDFDSGFTVVASTITPYVTKEVEIPSPFIKTGFLP